MLSVFPIPISIVFFKFKWLVLILESYYNNFFEYGSVFPLELRAYTSWVQVILYQM